MGYRVVQIVSLLGLLVVFGTAFLLGSEKPPPPEYSSNKPAAGLKMECKPSRQTYSIGDKVAFECALVNSNLFDVPLTWDPRAGNFSHSESQELRPIGMMQILVGTPEFITPMTLEPGGAFPGEYSHSLSPKENLVFQVPLGTAGKAGEFRGRILYDPRPNRYSIGYEGSVDWENIYAFSQVFEYKVKAREE